MLGDITIPKEVAEKGILVFGELIRLNYIIMVIYHKRRDLVAR